MLHYEISVGTTKKYRSNSFDCNSIKIYKWKKLIDWKHDHMHAYPWGCSTRNKTFETIASISVFKATPLAWSRHLWKLEHPMMFLAISTQFFPTSSKIIWKQKCFQFMCMPHQNIHTCSRTEKSINYDVNLK